MPEPEVVDAELVPYEQPQAVNLFGASEPALVIERAAAVANVLSRVLEEKNLLKEIQGRKHVLVEGWTMLGSMLGVFPVCVWTRKLQDPEGWEARVEARTRSGEVVGAAEAQCTRAEAMWGYEPKSRHGKPLQPRDDFALRSMAQTRATAKALRLPLGFVVTLAGYAETPADEMPDPPAQPTPPADPISDAQHRKIGAMLRELEEKRPPVEGTASWVDELRDYIGVTSRTHMSKAQASDAIEWLQGHIDAAEIPFG